MPTSTSELQKQLRDLVATSKTEKAITELRILGETPEYRHLNNLVIQQAAAFQKLRTDRIKGLLSFEKETRRTNAINDALLEIINLLDEQSMEANESNSEGTVSQTHQELTGNDNIQISDVHNSSINIHHHHYPTNEES